MLDVGLAYLYVPDTGYEAVRIDPPRASSGASSGEYDSVWILGAQYSMSF